MAATHHSAQALTERATNLAQLERALDDAGEGEGGVASVQGPAGIGKSALLAAATAEARTRGMCVLTARCAELESSLPYAVVRQLFAAIMSTTDPGARGALLAGAAAHAAAVVDPRSKTHATPTDATVVLHGLYWLTANLAESRPVALIVDDAHWSDPSSARWLAYLARRIEGLPVALIAASRTLEPGGDTTLLEELHATSGIHRVTPAPLSVDAVLALARARLGPQAESVFGRACHAATGGNPFYVTELLRVLAEDGVQGTAATVPAITALTPRTVVEATLSRLARMPADARTVATAIAVLEPRAELVLLARLTELDEEDVAAAVDALRVVGLLADVAPAGFAHPILRSAVAAEIAPARCAVLHRKAAATLAAARLPEATVAAHLMQTPPSGEPWVVATLSRAAALAMARGAPTAARDYLERALAERPAPGPRRELLLALGRAEDQLQLPSAVTHLREAFALARNTEQAAVTALALGSTLGYVGALDEACELAMEVALRPDGQGSTAMLELQSWLLIFAPMAGRTAETAGLAATLEKRAPHGSAAAGGVQASLALRALATGATPAQVSARAARAVAELERSPAAATADLEREAPGAAFMWADDLDRADALFTQAIDGASRMGRRRSFQHFSALRGFARRRCGDLVDAAADVEPILSAVAQGDAPGASALFALTTQVLLLVEAEQPEAGVVLARAAAITPQWEAMPIVALLRHAQGVAQLAARDAEGAAVTLAAVGASFDADGMLTPAILPWRSSLALALAGGDRHEEGRTLARAELALADRGPIHRARGLALRALGLLEGGEQGLMHLKGAAAAFAQTPARLEHGWACCELGAALRRAGRRREARAPLDEALDRALTCGAAALGRRAREELQTLGARPRSVLTTGAEALTPSERRVSRLASDGLTNREIAQALFVTLRTVETHLSSTYRKLGIGSRAELSQTLDAA